MSPGLRQPKQGPSRSSNRFRAWMIQIMPRWPSLLLAAATLLCLIVGTWIAWQHVRPLILSGQQYLVDPQRIQITPPPSWIRTDIRYEVIRDASLDPPLSVLDERLNERIATAFEFHPWVAKVKMVTKLVEPSIQVDLIYRKPVMMVQIETNHDQLLPADHEGVRLPDRDFSPTEKRQYPRLIGIRNKPLEGDPWNDPRVTGAGRLAALLLDEWPDLRLSHIVPESSTHQSRQTITYRLVSFSGKQIPWGHAPQAEQPGELNAADKLKRLHEYIQLFGTLDPADGPTVLDVRLWHRRTTDDKPKMSPDSSGSVGKRLTPAIRK